MAASSNGIWGAMTWSLLQESAPMLLVYRVCVRDRNKPKAQKHPSAGSICLAHCLEGDRRVSAVQLLPQMEHLKNKHPQLLIHTEDWSCIQTTTHLILLFNRRKKKQKKTPLSSPLLTSDTSALQLASATATQAKASLLILSWVTWMMV